MPYRGWHCRCRLLLLLMTAGFLLSGPATRAELVVEDDAGREVRLQQPARRVVSLAPHITESIFAIGAGDRLVGTVAWSDYPADAGSLPVVGSAEYLNYEAILALRPDLVVTWQSGMGQAVIARLQGLGVPVYVSEPRRLEDIARSLRHYGILAGESSAGDAAATDFEARLQRLSDRFGQRLPVTVFYQIWHEPLLTLNGQHLVSSVIGLCGGINVFAAAVPLVPQVSAEAVLVANPQVIIASAGQGGRPEWLDDWTRWRQLAAVRRQQLHSIDADLLERPTPRILAGAEQLCGILDAARSQIP